MSEPRRSRDHIRLVQQQALPELDALASMVALFTIDLPEHDYRRLVIISYPNAFRWQKNTEVTIKRHRWWTGTAFLLTQVTTRPTDIAFSTIGSCTYQRRMTLANAGSGSIFATKVPARSPMPLLCTIAVLLPIWKVRFGSISRRSCMTNWSVLPTFCRM